jgi:molecular chaperone GrpE (heat shock protein)
LETADNLNLALKSITDAEKLSATPKLVAMHEGVEMTRKGNNLFN